MAPDCGIYEVRWALATECAGDLLTGHYLHSQRTGGGVGANVRGADGIGQREERVIGHWRFRVKDIHGRACQVAGA